MISSSEIKQRIYHLTQNLLSLYAQELKITPPGEQNVAVVLNATANALSTVLAVETDERWREWFINGLDEGIAEVRADPQSPAFRPSSYRMN